MSFLTTSLFVVLLLASNVVADTCGPFIGPFTVLPEICTFDYNVPSADTTNSTGGDYLSTFLSSSRPSYACAQAVSNYYCSVYYPQCGTGNVAIPPCNTSCNAVVTACAGDAALFDSIMPLPTQDYCDSLSTNATCMESTPTSLGSLYVTCEAYNNTKAIDGFPSMNENTIICTPNHTIPTQNMSYDAAYQVFNSLKYASGAIVDNSYYPCVKNFSNFHCANAVPACPSDNVPPVKRACRALCKAVISSCAAFPDFAEATAAANTYYQVPTEDYCNTFPETDCFYPTDINTNVGFFFGSSDPPNNTVPITTTTTTTGRRTSHASSTTKDIYPPGGPATGGGIGAGVLIGLLLIIGITMIIMKKQDSR